MIDRVIWIILDSVGAGEANDASLFGDVGADTLGHVSDAFGGIKLPNMCKLGLGNIDGIHGFTPINDPIGCYGKIAELSNGKETTIGHWEMTGIHTPNPFPTYKDGFPSHIIDRFIKESGVKGILGNKVASGTEIINELGDEHLRTGYPIIYTSADSVFQIAACEDIIPPDRLYKICRIARGILTGEDEVARVIARPFIKDKDEYVRTSNRRDFSKKPSESSLLSYLKTDGINVCAVGKIEDIFDGVGITNAVHTKDNMDGIDKTLDYMNSIDTGLIFTNLVEFDSKWGHRRDVVGYGEGLIAFDNALPDIIDKMRANDLLIINADHGCDPTFKGTDHTREFIPLLMYGKNIKGNVNLGIGDTFANIGQTIAQIFNTKQLSIGKSYLDDLI